MITPLPLPDRPSCRLTWIEYRPFRMMPRCRHPSPPESVVCYAKARHVASTRQLGRVGLRPATHPSVSAQSRDAGDDADLSAARLARPICPEPDIIASGSGANGPMCPSSLNRIGVGRTMVWPLRGYLGVTVRCFMLGSMA